MPFRLLPWQKSIVSTIPVMLGYIPLGIAFGVLAVQMGHPIWLAVLMSLAIYSGAGQFLLLSLLANNASLTAIALATFLLGSRHIFYGLSLLPRFQHAGWRKGYLMHAITDETYSLFSSYPHNNSAADFRLAALNQGWWTLGTLIGAVLGSTFVFNSSGMEFALTALFIVLTIELFANLKQARPFVIGLACALVAIVFLPRDYMLLSAIVGACLVLLLEYRVEQARHE